MIANKHPAEGARVAALRRYDILDTPRETDFDEIVTLCAQICDAPISVINLIDTNRQWFKAETGLGVRETPLDTSLCAHVILENDFVEIPDTLADSRMADNLLCTGDPGLRFYAGALLKTDDGYPIGTLCVLDHRPRRLNDFQRNALTVLARQVMTQLNLRALLAGERVLRHEIDHRVKNSLQTVGSFVALEQGATTSPEAAAVLESVAQQVHTVALLHLHITAADIPDVIELDNYLGRVIELLDQAAPSAISVEGQFAPITANAKQAGALAMIANELAANAVKHAFSAGGGRIVFIGTVEPDGIYRLICSDDGQGPEQPSPNRREGLGLSIIRASVRQLGGSIASEQTLAGHRTQIETRL